MQNHNKKSIFTKKQVLLAIFAMGIFPQCKSTTKQEQAEICQQARWHNLPLVKKYLADGFSINARHDYQEETLLMCAAGGQSIGVIEHLIEQKADVNLRDKDGFMALMKGMSFRKEPSESTVNVLLAAGADVNIRSHNGKTALTMAAYYGHASIIATLLKQGANTHDVLLTAMKNSDGPKADLLPVLIAAGVDLNPVDALGRTPLWYATDSKIERMLLKAGAKCPPPRHCAAGGVRHEPYGVAPQAGLYLRAQPSQNARALVLMPVDAEVLRISQKDEGQQETFSGFTGYWYRIRYQGKTGYAFGPFLYPIK